MEKDIPDEKKNFFEEANIISFFQNRGKNIRKVCEISYEVSDSEQFSFPEKKAY